MNLIKISIHPENKKVGQLQFFRNDVEDSKALKKLRNSDVFKKYNSVRNHVKPKFRKSIPMFLYAITEKGFFRIGLLADIFKHCSEYFPSFDFDVEPSFEKEYEPSFPLPMNFKLYNFNNFVYRDVQEEALMRIFTRGRGIIEVGTAGGKGLIMASVIKTIHEYNSSFSFTVVVPTHLIIKTIEEFKNEYGIESITGWGQGLKPDFSKKVLIVGPHALARQKNLENIDRNVCMIDECHIVKQGSGLIKIIDRYIETPNVIGFTGTISDETEDKWCCVGAIGKIIYKVPSQELKQKGFKTHSKVVGIKILKHRFKKTEKDSYPNENEYLINSKERNDLITNFTLKACKKNTLIPIEFDIQQQNLLDSFEGKTDRKILVIDGDVNPEDRQKYYEDLESDDDSIVIAKVGCMREGISINNLHFLVLPLIRKSFIRISQFIGRVERKHDDKEVAIIYDFFDDTFHSNRHFKKRMEIYKKEQIPYKTIGVNLI